MKKWLLVLLIPFLSGCSATWHMNRAVKKDPSILKVDTIVLKDTIYIPQEIVQDTLVLKDVDTVLVETEKVRVRILRNFDTIQLQAECKDTTIYVEKVVYRDKVVFDQSRTWKDMVNTWMITVITILSMLWFFYKIITHYS